jgi:hypothetical protein
VMSVMSGSAVSRQLMNLNVRFSDCEACVLTVKAVIFL